MLHQSTSCIPSLVCLVSLSWLKTASMFVESLCMGVHSRCFTHGCAHVMQACVSECPVLVGNGQFNVKAAVPLLAPATPLPIHSMSCCSQSSLQQEFTVCSQKSGPGVCILGRTVVLSPGSVNQCHSHLSCLPYATHCHQSHPGEFPGTIGVGVVSLTVGKTRGSSLPLRESLLGLPNRITLGNVLRMN